MKSGTVIRIVVCLAVFALVFPLGFNAARAMDERARMVADANRALDMRERSVAEASRPSEIGNREAETLTRTVDRSRVIPENGTIAVTDSTFSLAYDELYNNREKYYGREIEIAGFIEAQDGLPSGEFLIGRNLLWCCQDDMYFIGFLAVSAPGDAPKPGESVRVSGTIEAMAYTDDESGKTFDVPAIRVRDMERVGNLQREVFPY